MACNAGTELLLLPHRCSYIIELYLFKEAVTASTACHDIWCMRFAVLKFDTKVAIQHFAALLAACRLPLAGCRLPVVSCSVVRLFGCSAVVVVGNIAS